MRLIITFKNLHQVLKSERVLKAFRGEAFDIRPTPTPPGLSTAVCGMSIEVLQLGQLENILTALRKFELEPDSVHEVDT